VFFLSSAILPALEITEAELARLETILTELQTQNNALKLSVADLTFSLQKGETSLQEYVTEVQTLEKNRDRWRTVAVVGLTTSVVSILSFIMAMFLKGD